MPSSVQITICGLMAGMWGLIPIRRRTRGLIVSFALGISLLFHLLATDTPFQNPKQICCCKVLELCWDLCCW